jgi:hypothetical protein
VNHWTFRDQVVKMLVRRTLSLYHAPQPISRCKRFRLHTIQWMVYIKVTLYSMLSFQGWWHQCTRSYLEAASTHCWRKRHSGTALAMYAMTLVTVWMPWCNVDLLVPAGTSTHLNWIQCGFNPSSHAFACWHLCRPLTCSLQSWSDLDWLGMLVFMIQINFITQICPLGANGIQWWKQGCLLPPEGDPKRLVTGARGPQGARMFCGRAFFLHCMRETVILLYLEWVCWTWMF